MKLWIDNTSLHAAARCLEGRAGLEDDVQGLLHLATELIFSEKVLVSGTETSGVRAQSEQVLGRLLDAGFASDVVYLADSPLSDFKAACRAAAQAFYRDHINQPAIKWQPKDVVAARPDLNKEELLTLDQVHRRLLDLSSSPLQPEDLSEAWEIKVGGAALAMIGSSPELCDLIVRWISTTPSWDESDSSKLISQLRMYLHQELGRQQGCVYAPALARAKRARSLARTIASRLESVAHKVAQQIQPLDLGLPPVASALVRRSHGYPTAILEEACRLRDLAKELRIYLSQIGWSSEVLPLCDLAQTISELESLLERDLYPDKRPKLRNAISSLGVLPLPTLELDVNALCDWVAYKMNRKRVLVLTEVSSALVYGEDEQPALQRLRMYSGLGER